LLCRHAKERGRGGRDAESALGGGLAEAPEALGLGLLVGEALAEQFSGVGRGERRGGERF